jgi:hypothetical protein
MYLSTHYVSSFVPHDTILWGIDGYTRIQQRKIINIICLPSRSTPCLVTLIFSILIWHSLLVCSLRMTFNLFLGVKYAIGRPNSVYRRGQRRAYTFFCSCAPCCSVSCCYASARKRSPKQTASPSAAISNSALVHLHILRGRILLEGIPLLPNCHSS